MNGHRTSSLLIDEQPLQVIPTLAAKLGINQAILLQQINYWIKIAEKAQDARKYKGEKWWTYNTYSDWQEQMPWLSESGIRKLVKQLRDQNLIAVVKHNKQGQDHTLWYTINYDAVEALSADSDVSESDTSMCPDGAADVSESDTSYATESLSESSEEESYASSSGEAENGSPELEQGKPEQKKPEQEKVEPLGAYASRELMERVSASRERGTGIHDPVNVGNYGQFFKNRAKRHEIDTLLSALDYLVAKAGGEIEGEPKAWCGFDTALDAVLAGWSKAGNLEQQHGPTPEQQALAEQNRRDSLVLLYGENYERTA